MSMKDDSAPAKIENVAAIDTRKTQRIHRGTKRPSGKMHRIRIQRGVDRVEASEYTDGAPKYVVKK